MGTGRAPTGATIAAIVAMLVVPALPGTAGSPPHREIQQTSRTRLSTTAVAAKASRSVVTITTPGGYGSGVIVDPTGVVVTNLHVVRGERQVSIKLANGDVYDAVVVYDVDERKDIVVLKIKAFGLPAADLANSDDVQVGDRVALIGSPQGLEQSVSDGIISAVRDSGKGYSLFQTSAAASPGSSGGGMFNEFGELVGIVSAKLTSGENLNFAVPLNYVRGLLATQAVMTLDELAYKFPAEPAGQPAETPLADEATLARQLAQLLEDSGLDYDKATETSWSTSFAGDHLEVVRIHLHLYGDLVVTQAHVREATSLSADQLKRILKLNFDADLAKLSLDTEDNLVALNETEVRVLDGRSLERIVQAVALMADDIAGALGAPLAVETKSRTALTRPPGTDRWSRVDVLRGHAALSYDSRQWREEKTDEPGIQQLVHSDGDLYARVIAERIEIPVEQLPDVALTNAKTVAPDVHATERGYRTVNGVSMLYMEYEGSISGVPFVFYGHFYSDADGTIQIIAWTGRNLIDEYRATIESLVSGFTVVR